MKFLENNRNAFIPLYPALERVERKCVRRRDCVSICTHAQQAVQQRDSCLESGGVRVSLPRDEAKTSSAEC